MKPLLFANVWLVVGPAAGRGTNRPARGPEYDPEAFPGAEGLRGRTAYPAEGACFPNFLFLNVSLYRGKNGAVTPQEYSDR